MPRPWVGRCRRCGLGYVDVHATKHERFWTCSHNGCGGRIHGVKGSEREAIKSAYALGGSDAVIAMYAHEIPLVVS